MNIISNIQKTTFLPVKPPKHLPYIIKEHYTKRYALNSGDILLKIFKNHKINFPLYGYKVKLPGRQRIRSP